MVLNNLVKATFGPEYDSTYMSSLLYRSAWNDDWSKCL